VFDTASQTIKNSWRNSKQKFANFMLNEAMYPNHRHGSHFLLFFLYELLISLRKAAFSTSKVK